MIVQWSEYPKVCEQEKDVKYDLISNLFSHITLVILQFEVI